MKRVGLYFGSFNPIHVGHLVIANFVAHHNDLDEVWLMVTPHNPLKEKSSLASEEHRLKMVQLATIDNPKVWAKDIEFNLPQPNYTINTLDFLKEAYPGTKFTLLMGEDNLRKLSKWKDHERIVAEYDVLVYPRTLKPGEEELDTSQFDQTRVTMCEAPVMNISSTFLRKSIQNRKDIRYLVVDEVINYLSSNKLYES